MITNNQNYINGRQTGNGAGFLRKLWILLEILIPPNAPLLVSIIQGWYARGHRPKYKESLSRQRKNNCNKYNPFLEANIFSAIEEVTSFINPKVHDHISKLLCPQKQSWVNLILIIIIIIIILYYLCAASTAVMPITDTAQCTYK
jgi:hypothetical protein